MEKEGSCTEVTDILGSLGRNTVKKTMRATMTTKTRNTVATMQEARFVRPEGGGGSGRRRWWGGGRLSGISVISRGTERQLRERLGSRDEGRKYGVQSQGRRQGD